MGDVNHSRPRVAILLRSLSTGGAERQAVLTARELYRRGYPVTLLVFYGGGAFTDEVRDAGIPLIELGKSGRWDLWRTWLRLERALRTLQPEVLYAYTPTPNIAALFCKLRFPRLAVVWGIRASNMHLSRYGRIPELVFTAAAWLSRFADAIVLNSESGLRHHAANGYATRRMSVISNGIDVMRFTPDSAAGEAVRRSLGVPPSAVLVGMVARLDPMKDHATFLRAAALFHSDRPDVRFVCVGDGPEEYSAALCKLAHDLGLEGRVLWAGRRDDVAAVYNALTVLTSSSISGEGFSNSIAEAMACGVPVVATDVGDSARIVGSAGVIVPTQDPVRLKDAWTRVLDAPCGYFSGLARERIVTMFGIKPMISATEGILLSAIERTRATHHVSPITSARS